MTIINYSYFKSSPVDENQKQIPEFSIPSSDASSISNNNEDMRIFGNEEIPRSSYLVNESSNQWNSSINLWNNNSSTTSSFFEPTNINQNNNIFQPVNSQLLDLNHSNSEINASTTTSFYEPSPSLNLNSGLPMYQMERDFNVLPSFPYHNYYSELTRHNSMPLTNFPTPPTSPLTYNNFDNEIYLKNDLDLLIYSSQQKFEEIKKFLSK